jgi:hypothetical protein
MTSSTRLSHLELADERAMEHEVERHNPVNPKQLLSNRSENKGRLAGAGATPSMGLSQFRGGAKLTKAKASEAHQAGLHLGKELLRLHGAGVHECIARGVMEGGKFKRPGPEAFGHSAPPERHVEHDTIVFDADGHRVVGPSPNEMARKAAKENYNARASPLEKGFQSAVSGLSQIGKAGLEHIHHVLPGTEEVGKALSKLIPSGSGKTGAYEGMGKKKRAPAGPSDGRRRRAEIVKKVMAEKGLSMIEASKFVKQNGLY